MLPSLFSHSEVDSERGLPLEEEPLRTKASASDEPDLKARCDWLFRCPCQYMQSAASLKNLPNYTMPEVAFAGRSNVGKSSLLNAVMNQKSLARTSNTPGRTQLLNFFRLANHLIVVDLPGFGYAKAPKDKVRAWTDLVYAYLQGRPTLKRVYLLIDSRHGWKKNDEDIAKTLDQAAVSYQIILTKVDKISKMDLEIRCDQMHHVCAQHPAAYPDLLITSAAKSLGLQELRLAMTKLAIPLQPGKR